MHLDTKSWLANSPLKKFLFIIYLIIVLILTLSPGRDLQDDHELFGFIDNIHGLDKIVHACMFFGMTILSYLAYPLIRIWRHLSYSFLFSFLIEIFQHIMPFNRTFDVWDLVANFIGAFTACLLVKFFLKKRFEDRILLINKP